MSDLLDLPVTTLQGEPTTLGELTGGRGVNKYDGGPGNDTLNAHNGKRETANCGAGFDKVRLNKNETKRVTACEVMYIFKDR